MENRQTLDISTSSILRVIFIVLGLYFLFLIREVLLMFFVALIIAAAVDGPVDWLAKHRVRRGFGVAIVYVLISVLLAIFSYLVFPTLAGQLKNLAFNLPDLLGRFGSGVQIVEQYIGTANLQKALEQLSSQFSGAASNFFGTTFSIFGGIFNALVVLVISIYLVIQDKGVKNLILSVAPQRGRDFTAALAEKIQNKLGAWLRGQLLLMLIVGVLSYVALLFLGVKFALILALVACLLEIVPYAGPIIGGALAVVMAFFQSPILALFVIIAYIIIQQIEGYLLSPIIMRKAVGLNPVLIIIALIVGGNLAGILGVVVSVPLAAVIQLIITDYFALRGRPY
jgi:predicted PurR-regulated permease PerM